MDRFKIFINFEILDEVPKSGKASALIMEFIKSLAEDPLNSAITLNRMKLAAIFTRSLLVTMPLLIGWTLQ